MQLEKENLPSNLPTLNPKLKRKKTKAPSHSLDEFFSSRRFVTIFRLG
jgi:hypothetical protein